MPKNSFAFLQADSSEDEGVQNMDPEQFLAYATKQATTKAKLDHKKKMEEAKKEAAMLQATAKSEPKEVRESKPKREPRANNGRRYGPRNEDRRRDNKDGDGQDDKKVSEGDRDNNRDRRQKRPRNQDRKSGNPRFGVKAQEKRGGAGAGNWGVATENLDDATNEVPSKEEDEANKDSAVENVAEGENDAENAEPQEPEEVQLSLEEYMKSLSTGDAAEEKSSSNKEAIRKANDGKELKGRVADKKFIYKADNNSGKGNASASNAKNTVSVEKLGFQSEYNRRGGRGGNRGGGRGDNRRGGDRQQKQREYKLDDASAFPTLGGK